MKSSNEILRLPQTIAKTGLSRSTIYGLIAAGQFPKQVKLSRRTIGFIKSEIDDWIAERANTRTE